MIQMNVHPPIDINHSLSPPARNPRKAEEKEREKRKRLLKVGEENFLVTANLHNISKIICFTPDSLSSQEVSTLLHLYKPKKPTSQQAFLFSSSICCFHSSIFPRMGKLGGAFVCLLIVVMDIVAGILGIEAEIAQNKVRHLRFMIFECKEPSNQAFLLGLGAAGLLGLAHVVAIFLGGCMCVCSRDEFSRSSSNKQLAVTCFVISWVVMAIGVGILVMGAMANNRSSKCGMSHHNYLSIGGIVCFVHGLFCVAYYVSATATFGEEEEKAGRRGSGAELAERHHRGLHA